MGCFCDWYRNGSGGGMNRRYEIKWCINNPYESYGYCSFAKPIYAKTLLQARKKVKKMKRSCQWGIISLKDNKLIKAYFTCLKLG